MKAILFYLVALGLWGCGEDPPAASGPTLEIAPRTPSNTFSIREFDGFNWVRSGQSLSRRW